MSQELTFKQQLILKIFIDQNLIFSIIQFSNMQTSTSRLQDSFMNPQSQSINKTQKILTAQIQTRNLQFKPRQNDIEGQEDFQQGKEIKQSDINIKKTSKSQKQSLLNSFNHNFQKHTVVTIKKLTKSIGLSFGDSKVEILAHQMWNVFIASGIKSKQILVILFGAANLQDQRYKELLKKCYFGQLCSFSQEIIRSAQQFLRQRVCELLTEERIKQNIEEQRNIRNRKAFFHYFMEFLNILKQGPLLKYRLNIKNSQRIVQRAKKFSDDISKRSQRRINKRRQGEY